MNWYYLKHDHVEVKTKAEKMSEAIVIFFNKFGKEPQRIERFNK